MSDSERGDQGAGASGTGESSDVAGEAGDDSEAERAIVLDHFPHGYPDDDRPQYQKSPLAQAISERTFRLVELTLTDDADVGIGDRIVIDSDDSEHVESLRELEYDDLSTGARNELEYVLEEIIDAHEGRFIEFYNDAQPITLRLHQLNLLPGIGKKLRNSILEQRKRKPFEDFEDLEERVSGLHRPKEVLIERIVEELRDEDLKYKTFVGREGSFVAGEEG